MLKRGNHRSKSFQGFYFTEIGILKEIAQLSRISQPFNCLESSQATEASTPFTISFFPPALWVTYKVLFIHFSCSFFWYFLHSCIFSIAAGVASASPAAARRQVLRRRKVSTLRAPEARTGEPLPRRRERRPSLRAAEESQGLQEPRARSSTSSPTAWPSTSPSATPSEPPPEGPRGAPPHQSPSPDPTAPRGSFRGKFLSRTFSRQQSIYEYTFKVASESDTVAINSEMSLFPSLFLCSLKKYLSHMKVNHW